jgi:hypothetical protein
LHTRDDHPVILSSENLTQRIVTLGSPTSPYGCFRAFSSEYRWRGNSSVQDIFLADHQEETFLQVPVFHGLGSSYESMSLSLHASSSSATTISSKTKRYPPGTPGEPCQISILTRPWSRICQRFDLGCLAFGPKRFCWIHKSRTVRLGAVRNYLLITFWAVTRSICKLICHRAHCGLVSCRSYQSHLRGDAVDAGISARCRMKSGWRNVTAARSQA